jgi:ATP-dependent exoDNAse (exonuclease V) beta subunit
MPRTLFVVGDGMQSIYGFRYADVRLFLQIRQNGLAGLTLAPLTLSQNFRSRQRS